MINYIKSEFYRLLHSKGSYLFIIICSALLISANVVLAAVGHTEENFPYNNTGFSFSLLYSYLPIIFILCVSVASIVFGNEHTNHTMKNSISYGISRGGIYFGKLITEVVYAVTALVLISGFYIGSAYLLLANSHSGDPEVLVRAYFAALPLLLFALATTNCFLFIIESTGGAITAVIGVLIAFPLVSNFLGMKFVLFRKLSEILPWNLINKMTFNYEKYQLILPWEGNTGYINYWLYGVLWMVLFVLIGFFVFRKKEIK
jgi:ABC-type transport system involved in multi-copper enzyme maturation permease subunit